MCRSRRRLDPDLCEIRQPRPRDHPVRVSRRRFISLRAPARRTRSRTARRDRAGFGSRLSRRPSEHCALRRKTSGGAATRAYCRNPSGLSRQPPTSLRAPSTRRSVTCSAGFDRAGDLASQADPQGPRQQTQRDDTQIGLDRSVGVRVRASGPVGIAGLPRHGTTPDPASRRQRPGTLNRLAGRRTRSRHGLHCSTRSRSRPSRG